MEMKEKVDNFLNEDAFFVKENISNDKESWDSYFMRVALLVSERSSCTHRKVGAVIVKDKRILATGYNQPPSGFPHCDEIKCIRDVLNIKSGEYQEICYGLHAEQNALMQAARFGISTLDASIYVTHQPCSICSRLIVNSGIKKVYYNEPYPDSLSKFFFKNCGIEIFSLKI
jgi:dCMP deaminase